MLPSEVISLREYVYEANRSPFGRWFDDLDAIAAARVTTALTRIAQGNFSSVKGVGAGVFESRINLGPGYRIYFGKDGDAVIILLAGGTKKRQSRDIADAQARWKDYKERKAQTE